VVLARARPVASVMRAALRLIPDEDKPADGPHRTCRAWPGGGAHQAGHGDLGHSAEKRHRIKLL